MFIAVLTVSNLSTVPVHVGELLVLKYIVLCSARCLEVLTVVVQFIKELLPDSPAALLGEVLVADDDVDSGNKGVVKVANSICREEQDAAVVLDGSKEHYKFQDY